MRAVVRAWPPYQAPCCLHCWRALHCSASQGLLYLRTTRPGLRNEEDCGVDEFRIPAQYGGGTIPLNCAGLEHAFFKDMDGSLLGLDIPSSVPAAAGRGIVMGAYNTSRSMPYAQGTPVTPGPCTYSSAFKAYICVPGSNAYTTDPARGLTADLKPTPMPKYGIYGDPQHFVLESRDADSETRNFSPVFFNVSGVVDMAVPQCDQGWCFTYGCQKRLSTFFTYLPTWQVTHISFGGTPARIFRLWLPYARPEDELIVTLNYMASQERCGGNATPGAGVQ